MRKNATKLAAALLSAALVVTSVNIPGAKADAASKVKISAKKATLYANGPSKKKTKTLTVTAGGKQVSAKFTSSKASVATVGKTSGKITAKKAGTTVIKATYRGKTYSCKVTVKKYTYIKKIAARPTEVHVAVGEKITPLKVTTLPSNPTVKKWKFYSSNNAVASVGLTAGWIKGRTDGEATITVKAIDGSKRYARVKVIVGNGNNPATEAPATEAPAQEVQAGSAAKIEGAVTNSLKSYENTVVANQSATLQFKVTDKDGNPVKNETVTITRKTLQAPNNVNAYYKLVGLNGNDDIVATETDSEGIAKVVLAPTTDLKKILETTGFTDAVASYKVTAICSSDENIKSEVTVSVGAVVYQVADKEENGTAVNNHAIWNSTDKANLEPGTNYPVTNVLKKYEAAKTRTTDLAGRAVDYLASQQVSAAGTEDHAVSFKSDVCIMLPDTTDNNQTATKYVQEVNASSGKYHTYKDGYSGEPTVKDIDFEIKDMSNVAYATLYFNKISISKYTQLSVIPYAYNDANELKTCEESMWTWTGAGTGVWNASHATHVSEWTDYTTTNQALQIPKDILDNYDGVRVVIWSAGQVNTTKNDGFDIKDLTYVYKSAARNDGKLEVLSDASITWEAVEPVWATKEDFTAALDTKSVVDHTSETATYTVPVFPYVGDGIITVYNKNKEAVRYYAVATVSRSVNGINKNVINGTATPYLITKDEAETINPGTVTGDGNTVKVNSEKAGQSFVKGTITSTDANLELDAFNSEIYTGVMWNPVENAAVGTDAFFALEGQTVKVTAQLVDRNGNKVTLPDKHIIFSDAKGTIAEKGNYGNNYDNAKVPGSNTATTYAKQGYTGYANVSSISNSGKTDKNGQVDLTLVGKDGAIDLIGLKAVCDDQTYNVVLNIGDSTVSTAEIYWAKVYLEYANNATAHNPYGIVKNYSTKTAADGKVTVPETLQSYEVKDVWEIGTVLGAEFPHLTGRYNATDQNNFGFGVSGLKIHVTQGTDYKVGSFTGSDDATGLATVTSDVVGHGTSVNKLDKTSVTADTKFTILYADAGKNVGTGDPTIDETLTIGYRFGSNGIVIEKADPMGYNAIASAVNANTGVVVNGSEKVKIAYVKVQNTFGGAVAGRTVVFTLNDDVTSTDNLKKTNMAFFADNQTDIYGHELTNMKAVTSAKINNNKDANGTLGNTDCKVVTAVTDANGIAAVAIVSAAAQSDGTDWEAISDTINLNAKVLKSGVTNATYAWTNTSQVESESSATTNVSYTFKPVKDGFAYDLSKCSYTTDSITLTFNKDLANSDILKDKTNYRVIYVNGDGTKNATAANQAEYTNDIKSVEVNGKTVKITLNAAHLTGPDNAEVHVRIKDFDAHSLSAKDDDSNTWGIRYALTSVDGQEFNNNDNEVVISRNGNYSVLLNSGTIDAPADTAATTAVNAANVAIKAAKDALDGYTDKTVTPANANAFKALLDVAETAYNGLETNAYGDLRGYANYADLKACRDAYDKYAGKAKTTAADQTKANDVIALIVTASASETQSDITVARTAYNALTDAQKALVTNASRLFKLELAKDLAEFRAAYIGKTYSSADTINFAATTLTNGTQVSFIRSSFLADGGTNNDYITSGKNGDTSITIDPTSAKTSDNREVVEVNFAKGSDWGWNHYTYSFTLTPGRGEVSTVNYELSANEGWAW